MSSTRPPFAWSSSALAPRQAAPRTTSRAHLLRLAHGVEQAARDAEGWRQMEPSPERANGR